MPNKSALETSHKPVFGINLVIIFPYCETHLNPGVFLGMQPRMLNQIVSVGEAGR